MYTFKPWTPKGQQVAVRYYINGSSDEYLGKRNNKIHVTALTIGRKRAIEDFLESSGIDLFTIGLRELGRELEVKGLISGGRQRGFQSSPVYNSSHGDSSSVSYGNFGRTKKSHPAKFSFANKSPESLYMEADHLDPSSAPFKDSARGRIAIAVDHREPNELVRGIQGIGLNTTIMSLDAGDILISDMGDSSRLLLIERKTLTDLYTNITGDKHHAHHQAERYFDMMVAYAREGVSLQVIWLIEGERTGAGEVRGLYNLLPEVKQVDGWLNYLVAICGQYVLPTMNTNHSCYMVAKLAQGWQAKSLHYPVKVGNVRIDKSRAERAAMTGEFQAPVTAEPEHRGVIRADDGLIGMLNILPCINKKIAKNLAETGKSFVEIASMTVDELKAIDGVGEKTAKNIRQVFDSRL
ncbi:ERCC4 domain-containing protein [Vibrio chagasii]|nr:ERCC4 domain-containing protein [Vibrio chagasii]